MSEWHHLSTFGSYPPPSPSGDEYGHEYAAILPMVLLSCGHVVNNYIAMTFKPKMSLSNRWIAEYYNPGYEHESKLWARGESMAI